MLDTLTAEDFEPHIGQPFDIHYGDGQMLSVVLVEVQRSPYPPIDTTKRTGFSLLFQSAIRDYLPQGIYSMTLTAFNSVYGDLDLFIVPLKPNAEGIQYEAIFN
jgi:hypothetical protein